MDRVILSRVDLDLGGVRRMVTRFLALQRGVRMGRDREVYVFDLIRVGSVLILRLITRVICLVLRVRQLNGVIEYRVIVFRRQRRRFRNEIRRVRRGLGVKVGRFVRLLVLLAAAIGNLYRVMT